MKLSLTSNYDNAQAQSEIQNSIFKERHIDDVIDSKASASLHHDPQPNKDLINSFKGSKNHFKKRESMQMIKASIISPGSADHAHATINDNGSRHLQCRFGANAKKISANEMDLGTKDGQNDNNESSRPRLSIENSLCPLLHVMHKNTDEHVKHQLKNKHDLNTNSEMKDDKLSSIKHSSTALNANKKTDSESNKVMNRIIAADQSDAKKFSPKITLQNDFAQCEESNDELVKSNDELGKLIKELKKLNEELEASNSSQKSHLKN